jgi:hypothetical protein
MKLCETSPELRDPATRRLAVLGAAVAEAVLEGMKGALADNLAEIERLRRELVARASESGSRAGA